MPEQYRSQPQACSADAPALAARWHTGLAAKGQHDFRSLAGSALACFGLQYRRAKDVQHLRSEARHSAAVVYRRWDSQPLSENGQDPSRRPGMAQEEAKAWAAGALGCMTAGPVRAINLLTPPYGQDRHLGGQRRSLAASDVL